MLSKEQEHQWVERILNRSLHIAVVGSGYVGLPTAALFVDAGFSVVVFDVQRKIVEAVNNGISPIKESGLQELVSRNVRAWKLRAGLNNVKHLPDKDVFMICVQTPIKKNKKPDLKFLAQAIEDVGKAVRKGTIAIISSTVPPKTTVSMVKPRLETMSGLKVDTDFYLAYAPERIAPGKALQEFVESPKLIGGIGPHSTRIVAELFKTVCKKIVETDATTAEIAKLAENTYRDVNIAFANQLALICERCGADVRKVIELANTHPRVNIHTPGPGVGGPCLPKDPYLLVNSFLRNNHNVIATSRQTNDNMPKHIVKTIITTLRKTGKSVENSKIAVLGTAYKENVDDARLSPAQPIIKGSKNSAPKPSSMTQTAARVSGPKRQNLCLKPLENLIA